MDHPLRHEPFRLKLLHGSNEVKQGKLLDLPAPRTESVELISGGERERVAVQK